MNEIMRRVVTGAIVNVTDRNTAVRTAKENLCRDPQKLIAEIERSIQMSSEHGQVHGSARGGHYTLEVVEQVVQLYRAQGWHVDFRGGYWLSLE